MREKGRRVPIYYDNDVDITDEISPTSYHHQTTQYQRSVSMVETTMSGTRIPEIDITDFDDNGNDQRKPNKFTSRRVSLPVSKVWIKNNKSLEIVSRRKSVCVSESSLSSFSESSSASSTSSQSCSNTSFQSCSSLGAELSEASLFNLVLNSNSLRGSIEHIDSNGSIYSDSDSIWDDDDDQTKFHVKLFNRYGRKGKEDEELQNATEICHVYQDTVLVTDMLNHKLLLFGRSGRPRKSFITEDCSEPWAAVVTARGYIAVTLRRKKEVAVWSARGETMFQFGHDVFKCPTGIAVGKCGRFVVTDEELNDVFLFSPGGQYLRSLGGDFKQPRYVCVSHSGKILVSDSGNNCIKVFDSNGSFLYSFGSYGSGKNQMKCPYGICVDQDENVFVADHYNDRISLYSIDGTFIQYLVTADKALKRPKGVSVRCSHNRKLYITSGGLRATVIAAYRLIETNSRLEIHMKCEV